MKRTQYGLTEAGFVIKPLSVILEEEKEAFRSAFGDDVDLSDESVAGAYVGNQAAKATKTTPRTLLLNNISTSQIKKMAAFKFSRKPEIELIGKSIIQNIVS